MAIFEINGSEIVESSGEIHRDLDINLTSEDKLKIELAKSFTRIVKARDYTQKDVALIIGVDQAKVSNILRGKLKDFSIERLVRFLLALGIDMDIHLSKTRNEEVVLPFRKAEQDRPSAGTVRVHTNKVAACG